jgi:hypothetical protein
MSGSGMCIYSLLITHYSKAVLKGQGFRPNYEGKQTGTR